MDLTGQIKTMGHEQVVFCHDSTTQLRAIIAIHDTTLGPSLGGCRFWDYQNDEEAIFDVLRLAKGMTYKAAIAGLNLGGGKSVIIGDPKSLKSEELFRSFGRFVHSLRGRYITAEDVNVKVEDMNIVGSETPYVTGVTAREGGSGDPSPITALGVFSGIRAAVKHKLGRDDLNGVVVGVQGIGAVGRNLCQLLHDAGAKLVVADIDEAAVRQIVDAYGAKASGPEGIHREALDVYAPCALGAIVNSETIPELKTTIVAGGANNQLLDEETDAKGLDQRGILYAPDYVINAGGLINVAHELKGYEVDEARKDACAIYDTLLKVFELAEKRQVSTIEASNQIAEERIAAAKTHNGFLGHTFENQDWIRANFAVGAAS